MTLNFSHRPIFPYNPPEDNLVSSIRVANGFVVDGIPDRNGDGFGKSRCCNWEIEDSYDYRRDIADWGGYREPASNDILDLLPSDPFGMDISATFTALTGWLEDMEVDADGFGRNEIGAMRGDYQLVTGLRLALNSPMRVQAEPGNTESIVRLNAVGRSDECVEEKELGIRLCDAGFVSFCNVEDFPCIDKENDTYPNHKSKEFGEGTSSCSTGGGAPHEALLFALHHLGVQDLLSAERACRPFHDAVQNDSLLWRNIHIDQPLSEKITDDALLQLASRAQGKLECLSLVECPWITDDGLKRVLESNQWLTKLSVPGCTRLSVEAIVNSLKVLKASGKPGIKLLRIGGLYGVTQKHFEELKFLLGVENQLQQKAHKPHFYHSGNLYLSCDDDRAIDVEMCPRCEKLRLVYDCPAKSCQGKQHASQLCRACTLCIARCVQCGRCINDSEYEETFCLDLLCSDCWKELPKLQERQEEKGDPSSKDALFQQQTRYHSQLYG